MIWWLLVVVVVGVIVIVVVVEEVMEDILDVTLDGELNVHGEGWVMMVSCVCWFGGGTSARRPRAAALGFVD